MTVVKSNGRLRPPTLPGGPTPVLGDVDDRIGPSRAPTVWSGPWDVVNAYHHPGDGSVVVLATTPGTRGMAQHVVEFGSGDSSRGSEHAAWCRCCGGIGAGTATIDHRPPRPVAARVSNRGCSAEGRAILAALSMFSGLPPLASVSLAAPLDASSPALARHRLANVRCDGCGGTGTRANEAGRSGRTAIDHRAGCTARRRAFIGALIGRALVASIPPVQLTSAAAVRRAVDGLGPAPSGHGIGKGSIRPAPSPAWTFSGRWRDLTSPRGAWLCSLHAGVTSPPDGPRLRRAGDACPVCSASGDVEPVRLDRYPARPTNHQRPTTRTARESVYAWHARIGTAPAMSADRWATLVRPSVPVMHRGDHPEHGDAYRALARPGMVGRDGAWLKKVERTATTTTATKDKGKRGRPKAGPREWSWQVTRDGVTRRGKITTGATRRRDVQRDVWRTHDLPGPASAITVTQVK